MNREIRVGRRLAAFYVTATMVRSMARAHHGDKSFSLSPPYASALSRWLIHPERSPNIHAF